MIISEYSVSLNSTNRYSQKKTSSYFNTVLSDTLKSGGGSTNLQNTYSALDERVDNEENHTSEKKEKAEEKKGNNSFGDLFEQSGFENRLKLKSSGSSSLSGKNSDLTNTMQRLHRQIIDYFLRWLFGDDYADKLSGSSESSAGSSGGTVIFMASGYMETYTEAEETTFSASGTVVDSEGRQIEFGMNFTLSRSFSAYTADIMSTRTVMTDPLILNFDGNLTDFSDQNFYFDLDCDGTKEQVTNLGRKSAFLALDKNEDGEINDGSELFGATSGNGFSDLMSYDEDGNGWIDENDSIFEKLRVFSVDSEGKRTLLSLKDAGVGAMYTGSSETDYHVTKDTAENASARLRRSGVFLYESGMVGSMVQADLAMYA